MCDNADLVETIPDKDDKINNNLPDGCFIVGNKLMAVCAKCGNMVRIDKPFVGSLHICL